MRTNMPKEPTITREQLLRFRIRSLSSLVNGQYGKIVDGKHGKSPALARQDTKRQKLWSQLQEAQRELRELLASKGAS